MSSSRVAPLTIAWWCGIAGTVVVLAGYFSIDAGGTTPADGPVPVLVQEVLDGRARTAVGTAVGPIGALLVVTFGAGLRTRLASNDAGADMLGNAGLAFAGIAAVGAVLHGSLRLVMTSVGDPNVLPRSSARSSCSASTHSTCSSGA